MKRCPICNRSSEEVRFFGEFCEDDAGKKLRSKLDNQFELTKCRDCDKIKVLGVFVPETKQNMERFLKSMYKHYSISLLHSGNGIARIELKDENHNGLKIEMNVHLKLAKVLCDSCAKKRAGYYEAVIQLRGEKTRVTHMAESLERYLERNGAFVTKTEDKEHGVDVYVSNKKAAFSFISGRHLSWKGSFELHGMKSGKRLYRNTYFITL